MLPPQPLYTATNCKPAYQLRWSLAVFWNTPAAEPTGWLATLQKAVEPDGVRILEHRFTAPQVSQFFLSTTPAVAPAQVVRSVKGRLQYLVRRSQPKAFRGNYSIKSIGSVTRDVVEGYIARQPNHHPMADQRVQERLLAYQIEDSAVDLGKMRYSSHGQYAYNLHLVLVNEGRWHEIRDEVWLGGGTRSAALA
jgi:hypothetical protein